MNDQRNTDAFDFDDLDDDFDDFDDDDTTENAYLVANVSLADLIAVNQGAHSFDTSVSTNTPGGRTATGAEADVLRHAQRGDHIKASRSHREAAEAHEKLAEEARKEGRRRLAQHHDEAAARHNRAAIIHMGSGQPDDLSGNAASSAIMLPPQVLRSMRVLTGVFGWRATHRRVTSHAAVAS